MVQCVHGMCLGPSECIGLLARGKRTSLISDCWFPLIDIRLLVMDLISELCHLPTECTMFPSVELFVTRCFTQATLRILWQSLVLCNTNLPFTLRKLLLLI